MPSGPRKSLPIILGAMMLAFVTIGSALADETSTQIWLDYNPSWQVSPKTNVGGDVGYRTRLESGGHRLVLRGGVSGPYRFFTLSAGIGNFLTLSDAIQNRWELRPYQGVGWVWPRTRVIFDHLVRLEERFDFNTVTWTSVNSLRGRYRIRARYLFAETRPDRFWRAFTYAEFFLKMAGEEGLQREQFRLTFGLERSFHLKLRMRLETTWEQEEVILIPNSSADAIYFRFRVYQNF